MRILAAALIHLLLVSTAATAAPPRNPLIDYAGFRSLTGKVDPERRKRLVSLAQFKAMAARPGTLVLDARSANAFAAGHIAGAVNLPFTDFTANSLAAAIGPDKRRPILIYCNNNFSNNVAPVRAKAVALALNIQTFINLVGYGYPNVWELNQVVDFTDPQVGWVAS